MPFTNKVFYDDESHFRLSKHVTTKKEHAKWKKRVHDFFLIIYGRKQAEVPGWKQVFCSWLIRAVSPQCFAFEKFPSTWMTLLLAVSVICFHKVNKVFFRLYGSLCIFDEYKRLYMFRRIFQMFLMNWWKKFRTSKKLFSFETMMWPPRL